MGVKFAVDQKHENPFLLTCMVQDLTAVNYPSGRATRCGIPTICRDQWGKSALAWTALRR